MSLKGVGHGSRIVEPASWASTGTQELARRKALPLLQTGNATLDQLLGGGIEPGVVTLLYSASRRLSLLLQQLAVLVQLPPTDGGFNAARVLYVDGENSFDPYGMAQFALTHHLDPTRALGNIFLARAFQWGQVVEIVQEKLVAAATAKDTPLVCIAGLTTMLSWRGIRTPKNNAEIDRPVVLILQGSFRLCAFFEMRGITH